MTNDQAYEALRNAAIDGYKLGINHAIGVLDAIADYPNLSAAPFPAAITTVMALIRDQSKIFWTEVES